jgi:tetratricopeptide (TPR) repeat protein
MKGSRKKSPPVGGRRTPLDPACLALMRLVEAARYPEVEAAARRILDGRPSHPLALKALGFALIGQGLFEEAWPIVRFSLDRNPDDPEAHNNLGIVLSALMRWDESIQCFARSLEIKPRDPEVLKNYGVALSRMRKWDEAVPYFLKAIEYHPGDYVEAIEQLAGALLNSNRNDEAWTCFNELWKNDQSNAAILSQLLSASLKRCDWDELEARLLTLRSLTAGLSLTDVQPLCRLVVPRRQCRRTAQGRRKFRSPQHPGERARCPGTSLVREPGRAGLATADWLSVCRLQDASGRADHAAGHRVARSIEGRGVRVFDWYR